MIFEKKKLAASLAQGFELLEAIKNCITIICSSSAWYWAQICCVPAQPVSNALLITAYAEEPLLSAHFFVWKLKTWLLSPSWLLHMPPNLNASLNRLLLFFFLCPLLLPYVLRSLFLSCVMSQRGTSEIRLAFAFYMLLPLFYSLHLLVYKSVCTRSLFSLSLFSKSVSSCEDMIASTKALLGILYIHWDSLSFVICSRF